MKPFSVKSLAERWECSQDTIRAMIERGDLPCFRAGGKLLRIRGEDVLKWESTGASTQSDHTDLGNSKARQSRSGATKKERTAEDWAAQLPK